MREQLIPPYLARMLVADEDTLSAPSKIVFHHNNETGLTLFGGRAAARLSDKIDDQEWHLAEGTLIFIPRKICNWKADSPRGTIGSVAGRSRISSSKKTVYLTIIGRRENEL